MAENKCIPQNPLHPPRHFSNGIVANKRGAKNELEVTITPLQENENNAD